MPRQRPQQNSTARLRVPVQPCPRTQPFAVGSAGMEEGARAAQVWQVYGENQQEWTMASVPYSTGRRYF